MNILIRVVKLRAVSGRFRINLGFIVMNKMEKNVVGKKTRSKVLGCYWGMRVLGLTRNTMSDAMTALDGLLNCKIP